MLLVITSYSIHYTKLYDQVDALKKKGVKAAFINSTVPVAERQKRLDDFVYGDLKFLYVTPERFRQYNFMFRLKRAKISLFARNNFV